MKFKGTISNIPIFKVSKKFIRQLSVLIQEIPKDATCVYFEGWILVTKKGYKDLLKYMEDNYNIKGVE